MLLKVPGKQLVRNGSCLQASSRGAAALQHAAVLRSRLPQRRQIARPRASLSAAAGNDEPSRPQEQQQQVQKQRLRLGGWLPSVESRSFLISCWQLLRANLAAIVVIHAVKEGIVFLLHRATQRATNAVAEGLLGVQLPPFVNPWYLFMEPKFVEVNWGYQVVVALFFLLSLPINILFNSAATAASALVCVGQHRSNDVSNGSPSAPSGPNSSTSGDGATTSSSSSSSADDAVPDTTQPAATFSDGGSSEVGRPGQARFRAGSPPPPGAGPGRHSAGARPAPISGSGPVAQLRSGISEAKLGYAAARPLLRRAWLADLAFNAWSLPLQALSLLVFPVFWAFPRLLAIQLSVPAAVLAGTGPKASLELSRQLMQRHAASYAWPYLALTLLSRAVDAVKQALLLSVPERWWQEVIEIPVLVTVAFTVAKVLAVRMQDLLPLATYLGLQGSAEKGGAAASSAADAKKAA